MYYSRNGNEFIDIAYVLLLISITVSVLIKPLIKLIDILFNMDISQSNYDILTTFTVIRMHHQHVQPIGLSRQQLGIEMQHKHDSCTRIFPTNNNSEQ